MRILKNREKTSLIRINNLILKIEKLKATNNFDREAISDGIFLADAMHKDVQPLADRPMRAANMPVDRRIYASIGATK